MLASPTGLASPAQGQASFAGLAGLQVPVATPARTPSGVTVHTRTHAARAHLLGALSAAHSAQATLLAVREPTHLARAVLAAEGSHVTFHDARARLKATSTRSHDTRVTLRARTSATHGARATLRARPTRTHSARAWLGTSTPGAYPEPGDVGFLGDEGDLTIIDRQANAPSGTTWNGVAGNGYLQVDDDLTLDGVYLKGGLDFYGDHLTITNSVIEFNGIWVTIVGRTLHSTITVQDCTLRWREGDTPDVSSGGGAFQVLDYLTFTIQRCDISGTADGMQLGGDDTLVEHCYIHDLATLGTFPNNTHNDGIQVFSGSRMILRENRIDIGFDGLHQNAAIFFQPQESDVVPGPTITGNYLSGGGYTLRFEADTTDAVVTDNVFVELGGGQFGDGYVNAPATIATWSGNVHDDDTPVPEFT